MLKEKQNQLKDKINKIIKEIGHRNDIKQEIGKEFKFRNLSAYQAINLFTNPDSIFTLTDSDNDVRFLFLFSVALNKALKLKNEIDIEINVQDYFTQLENKQWMNYKEGKEQDDIYPIVFENVQQLAEGMWQTTISAQQLAELDKNNLLLYNYKTQRNLKVTVFGVKIDLDRKKVMIIRDRILDNKQFPDHIKLNVLKNYEEEMYYDLKSRSLIINKGFINISDGQHRKVSNSLIVEENPEINFTWGLIITNYTEADARDYILQLNEQKPFKKEQKKTWDLNKKENLVVSAIADDRISKLAKVMKEQYSEIKLNKGLVTKNIIAEAIAENYQLDETTDIRELGNWIVEFTDYLFNLYLKEFIIDPYSIRDILVINHRNIFYGYIALSAKLQYNDEWKKITKSIMQSINFNMDNQIWRDISLLTNKMNKSSRNKLYKFFTKEV